MTPAAAPGRGRRRWRHKPETPFETPRTCSFVRLSSARSITRRCSRSAPCDAARSHVPDEGDVGPLTVVVNCVYHFQVTGLCKEGGKWPRFLGFGESYHEPGCYVGWSRLRQVAVRQDLCTCWCRSLASTREVPGRAPDTTVPSQPLIVDRLPTFKQTL